MPFDPDFGDLSAYIDPEPDEEFGNMTKRPGPMYGLPALGLDTLEGDNRFAFHVVNASPDGGDALGELFGEEKTLVVDGEQFKNADHLIHQLDVLSRGGKEQVRIVFANLGEVRPEVVGDIEPLFDRKLGYPIKSIYFIDDGSPVERNFRHKVLMRCKNMIDAATLLDAVAFGWGSKNPYDGKPVGGEEADYTDGGEQAFVNGDEDY